MPPFMWINSPTFPSSGYRRQQQRLKLLRARKHLRSTVPLTESKCITIIPTMASLMPSSGRLLALTNGKVYRLLGSMLIIKTGELNGGSGCYKNKLERCSFMRVDAGLALSQQTSGRTHSAWQTNLSTLIQASRTRSRSRRRFRSAAQRSRLTLSIFTTLVARFMFLTGTYRPEQPSIASGRSDRGSGSTSAGLHSTQGSRGLPRPVSTARKAGRSSPRPRYREGIAAISCCLRPLVPDNEEVFW
jgi:hypothetical protein